MHRSNSWLEFHSWKCNGEKQTICNGLVTSRLWVGVNDFGAFCLALVLDRRIFQAYLHLLYLSSSAGGILHES